MARLLAILIVLLNVSLAYARPPESIGYRQNSSTGSPDYCLKFQDESGTVINDRCKPIYISDDFITNEGDYFLIRTNNGGTSGTSMTTGQTSVSTSYKYIRKAIASDPAFSIGTLGNGKSGQILTIQITEVQAGGTWTLTPTKKTGFVSLRFEAVGDLCTLLYVNDFLGWIVLSNESVEMVQ